MRGPIIASRRRATTGPGALIADGDNEINGVMALGRDFEPVPEPGLISLMVGGLLGIGLSRRKKIVDA